jgi:hypothetical protein
MKLAFRPEYSCVCYHDHVVIAWIGVRRDVLQWSRTALARSQASGPIAERPGDSAGE